MKKNKEEIQHQLWNQCIEIVNDQVCGQVYGPVYGQIWHQVGEKLRDQVEVLIKAEMNEK